VSKKRLSGIAFGDAGKTRPYAERCVAITKSVPPEGVGFGSGQGLSVFETAGASVANAYRGA